MRLFSSAAQSPISGRFARRIVLLLLLTAGLSSFLVLLNMLPPLHSPEQGGLLAAKPLTQAPAGLPTGVGFLTVSVLAVSVVLGAAALLLSQPWPPRLGGLRLSWPLAGGMLAAVLLVGLGTYLALSGALSQEVSYEQSLVERSLLRPTVLAVIAGFFLLILLTGILNPKLLAPTLVALLVAGIFVWVLNSLEFGGSGTQIPAGTGSGTGPRLSPIDTKALVFLCGLFALGIVAVILTSRSPKPAVGSVLRWLLWALLTLLLLAAILFWLLSPRASEEQLPSGAGGTSGEVGIDEGATVQSEGGVSGTASSGAQEVEEVLRELEQAGADIDRLENGGAVVGLDGEVGIVVGTTASRATEGDPVPLFEVMGAANTSYLRTSVGDVYEGGRWMQLDPVAVPYDGAGLVRDRVRDSLASAAGGFGGLPEWRRETAL